MEGIYLANFQEGLTFHTEITMFLLLHPSSLSNYFLGRKVQKGTNRKWEQKEVDSCMFCYSVALVISATDMSEIFIP